MSGGHHIAGYAAMLGIIARSYFPGLDRRALPPKSYGDATLACCQRFPELTSTAADALPRTISTPVGAQPRP